MASTPKQVNGNASPSNGPLGKRKKSKTNKSSYLAKWLDKAVHHVHESAHLADGYDNPHLAPMNWSVYPSQFAPGYDPHRYMYGSNEPTSLPSMPTYNPMMHHYPEYRTMRSENKCIQVQRPRIRRRSKNRAEELSSTPADVANQNYMEPKNMSDSQDFASLPPIVTSTGDTNSNSELLNDKDEGNNARRYSDPCMRELPDVADHGHTNGDVESDSGSSSGLSGSQVGSRLLSYLLDQITSLKLVNERLTKELQETKAELESFQHSNTFYGKGASLGAGGQYSPGFLTEMVRDIRDGTRIREESMYARLRNLVLERTDTASISSETKALERNLEEIKFSWQVLVELPICLPPNLKHCLEIKLINVLSPLLLCLKVSLRASEADKRCMMDRINKLEEELRLLRVGHSFESERLTNGNGEDAETERARLRKELLEMRKAKQSAEEQTLKLERLVTQLRSKFNGLHNGPESLASDEDARPRRASATFVCGPVTDL